VPSSQRSLGLGIQWLIVRLLGSIPAPIVFGALMDSTCILWHKSCDGESGSCRAYDNSKMSQILLIVALIGKGVSLVSFILAWIVYKPPQHNPLATSATLDPGDILTNKDPNNIAVISKENIDNYSVTLLNHSSIRPSWKILFNVKLIIFSSNEKTVRIIYYHEWSFVIVFAVYCFKRSVIYYYDVIVNNVLLCHY